jgi:hypothetical protein
MAYDLHGSWDKNETSVGPFVYADSNLTEIETDMELLWRNNIDPAKLNLGIGFYGRGHTCTIMTRRQYTRLTLEQAIRYRTITAQPLAARLAVAAIREHARKPQVYCPTTRLSLTSRALAQRSRWTKMRQLRSQLGTPTSGSRMTVRKPCR